MLAASPGGGLMILAILATAAAIQGPLDLRSPQSAARAFYQLYLRTPHDGVPGPVARSRLRPVVSARLDALLARADRAEIAHTRRTHNQEPPILEGDVFTSLFEGASRSQVEGCQAWPTRAICSVALSYQSPHDKPARWRDRVVLIHAGGGWRVDDVVYGGTWAFGNKGRLSDSLKSVVSEARE